METTRRSFRPGVGFVGACVLALVSGCGESTLVEPLESTPLFSMNAASASSADAIEDFGLVAGAEILSASLNRTSRGVRMRMAATVPAPNTATVWGVVFNAPEHCAGSPCGLGDLGIPDAQASIVRAGGRVVGGDRVTISGQIREGDTSEALFGPGLSDAMTAEIHFILRVHGEQIPTQVDDQIHSVGGGCGVNACADVGAAIFLPPAG